VSSGPDTDRDGPNAHVYIHEVVDIVGPHRAAYLHHMAANWSPLAQETRDQRLFGIWAVLGSTSRWPRVVNLWEEKDWHGLAASFEAEAIGAGLQDPDLERWWRAASTFRSGGLDRLLEPAPWSPAIDDLCGAGPIGPACVVHDLVTVEPGAARDHLDRVRSDQAPALHRFGWRLIGAFTTGLRDDDECVLLWAVPTWAAWADVQVARPSDEGLRSWAAQARPHVEAAERMLLVDGPLSPLRTGRQPNRSDRTDWTDAPT
jgi:hypothetical protein